MTFLKVSCMQIHSTVISALIKDSVLVDRCGLTKHPACSSVREYGGKALDNKASL